MSISVVTKRVLDKLDIGSPYDPAILPIDIPKKLELIMQILV